MKTYHVTVTEHRTFVYRVVAENEVAAIAQRDHWTPVEWAEQHDHGRTLTFEMVEVPVDGATDQRQC